MIKTKLTILIKRKEKIYDPSLEMLNKYYTLNDNDSIESISMQKRYIITYNHDLKDSKLDIEIEKISKIICNSIIEDYEYSVEYIE